jgi:Tat protein secretion system quality control protein TatD with DNase activity
VRYRPHDIQDGCSPFYRAFRLFSCYDTSFVTLIPTTTMAEVVEALPKKIILCCDGTWQSSVSGKHNLPSNITHIARTIAKAG